MSVLAIDPGCDASAYVIWDGKHIHEFGKADNDEVMLYIKGSRDLYGLDFMVIEQIKSYGMAVGAEIFETCVWSGRFMEAFGADRVHRIPRMDVKVHLCNSAKAKDANIRQALIDRFGAPGTKSKPGMLYGVTKDVWAALAVAVTWWDKQAFAKRCA